MTITSGGCNTLTFLLYDPEKIYAVDINPAQTCIMEFKIAAIKNLEHKEFLALLGLTECNNRLSLFTKIKHDLTAEAIRFWDSNIKLIEKGIFFNGKFERFVKLAGKMLALLQGRKKVNKLLSLQSVPEQKEFYKEPTQKC